MEVGICWKDPPTVCQRSRAKSCRFILDDCGYFVYHSIQPCWVFHTWFQKLCSLPPTCSKLRYKLIKCRLMNMGYTVVGDIFNAADFGVPQQRGRAWILCVQTAELRDSSALLKDVTQFHRIYVPVSKCLDLSPPTPTEGKERQTCQKRKSDQKWRKLFKEQWKLHGKDRYNYFPIRFLSCVFWMTLTFAPNSWL